MHPGASEFPLTYTGGFVRWDLFAELISANERIFALFIHSFISLLPGCFKSTGRQLENIQASYLPAWEADCDSWCKVRIGRPRGFSNNTSKGGVAVLFAWSISSGMILCVFIMLLCYFFSNFLSLSSEHRKVAQYIRKESAQCYRGIYIFIVPSMISYA